VRDRLSGAKWGGGGRFRQSRFFWHTRCDFVNFPITDFQAWTTKKIERLTCTTLSQSRRNVFFLQRIANINGPSWVVPWLPSTNPRWRTAPHYISWNANVSALDEDVCTQSGTECNTTMRRYPRDQKRNRKLIRMTSSVERPEHNKGRSPWLYEIFEPTIMAERAKFTYHENPIWRRPPYWISKNINISGLDEDISTKFGGQLQHGHMELITGTLIIYQLYRLHRQRILCQGRCIIALWWLKLYSIKCRIW